MGDLKYPSNEYINTIRDDEQLDTSACRINRTLNPTKYGLIWITFCSSYKCFCDMPNTGLV